MANDNRLRPLLAVILVFALSFALCGCANQEIAISSPSDISMEILQNAVNSETKTEGELPCEEEEVTQEPTLADREATTKIDTATKDNTEDAAAYTQKETSQPPTENPLEPEEKEIPPAQCTISISCGAVLSHWDRYDLSKQSIIPADGVILSPCTVELIPGDTVFDVLERVCREGGIPLEFSRSPLYGSVYIEGIANLYEYDCGELSGWMYAVNDWFPNYGCSGYTLSDGDVIRWAYSCELGADIGGDYAT